MSEWRVALTFIEGSSKKFWRARIDGGTLYVNYGRIGSGGQTQVKELGSPAAAEKELAKLEREKRNKGYEDEGSTPEAETEDLGDEDDGGEEETQDTPPPPPESTRFVLMDQGRNVELELHFSGSEVRTVVVEKYESPHAAKAAFDRLGASILEEGYKKR